MAVIPVAKALYLCEEIDDESGAINLYALFNTIHAPAFPYTPEYLTTLAQLTGGMGEVTVHSDVSQARDDRVIYFTDPRTVRFQRRAQTLQLVMTFEGVVFDEPGYTWCSCSATIPGWRTRNSNCGMRPMEERKRPRPSGRTSSENTVFVRFVSKGLPPDSPEFQAHANRPLSERAPNLARYREDRKAADEPPPSA